MALRRHLGGTQEAPRRHPEAPRASRRPQEVLEAKCAKTTVFFLFSRCLYICKVASCPRDLPAGCVCVRAACGAYLSSEKTRPWIFGTCILLVLCYFVILSYLEAPWDPGGTQEAPRRHPGGTQGIQGSRSVLDTKSDTPLNKNAKAALTFKFYEGVLRVGITKYCKLQ